jgi:hypothetical protein
MARLYAQGWLMPAVSVVMVMGGVDDGCEGMMMTIMHLRPNPGTTVNRPPRLSIGLADSIPICSK